MGKQKTLRVMSLNINGIRAGQKKGFFEWFLEQDIDVLCLQEVRAMPEQIEGEAYQPAGYHCYFLPAEKKGYSGVAIYSKEKPLTVQSACPTWPEASTEGRFIQITLPEVTITSLYLPSGTSGDERQAFKYACLDQYFLTLDADKTQSHIICGDFNIVHTEKDIKNWKANQNSSGCLPEERAWLQQVFDLGYQDVFRLLSDSDNTYTWWSQRGRARANNVGWRIDYQLMSPGCPFHVTDVACLREPIFSDHGPVVATYQRPNV